MLINSKEELEKVAKQCRKTSTKAAFLSSLPGALPVPVVDVAADVTILINVIPRISKEFGLSKEQIDEYNDQVRILIFDIIKKGGVKLVGKYVTKDLIITLIKRMGIKVARKQIAKYIPVIGSIISGGMSFAAMKIICNQHINDCYNVAAEVLKGNGKF